MTIGNQIFLIPGLRLRRGTSFQGNFVGALSLSAAMVGEVSMSGSSVGALNLGAVMVGEMPIVAVAEGSVVGTLNLGATMEGEQPSSAFTPLDLFAASEEGAWYDPSDLSTLFQTVNGLNPVTADGQPVRLMLDKSKGLVPGSEVVVGGGFDDSSDWTDASDGTATVTISGGVATFACTLGNTARLVQNITSPGGSWYEVSFNVISRASGNLSLRLHTGGVTQTITTLDSLGVFKLRFFSLNVSQLQMFSAGNVDFVLDDISVRLLPGNHATAPSVAARPLYRTADGISWLDYDAVDDVMNSPNPSLGTSASRARAVLAGAVIETGLTIEANYADNTDHYGLILLNRAFTEGEQASLTAYLDGKAGL